MVANVANAMKKIDSDIIKKLGLYLKYLSVSIKGPNKPNKC